MVYGKLIGGLIGLLVAGFVGLVLGIFVGHAFDRGLINAFRFGSPAHIERIKNSFFETTFLLSGCLAKADGHISKLEIDHTESVFSQMGLSAQQRKRAIELFHQGAAPDFHLESAVSTFLQTCGPQRQIQQTLLLFLVSLALADHKVEPEERAVLERIASLLGVGRSQLDQILRMAQGQDHFHGRGGYTAQPGTTLDDAYAALGVDSQVSDRDLKRAYRKRMSENHPDKLMAKGVPEDMIRLATERSQEIQAAYQMIRKARGLN